MMKLTAVVALVVLTTGCAMSPEQREYRNTEQDRYKMACIQSGGWWSWGEAKCRHEDNTILVKYK